MTLEQMGEKHLKVIEKNGINLDIHWITTMPLLPKLDKPLRKWEQTIFHEQREYISLDGIKVQVPPPLFNAIFLFMHMFNHFMSEGVSYRQICDWGLSLRDERVRQEHSTLVNYISQYDLVLPWKVFSYVAVHHLGFNAADFPLYQDDCKQKVEIVLKGSMKVEISVSTKSKKTINIYLGCYGNGEFLESSPKCMESYKNIS